MAARRCTSTLSPAPPPPLNNLYRGLGWTLVGGIPNYATDTSGTPEKNAIYYKLLE